MNVKIKAIEVDDGTATAYRACPPWHLRLAASLLTRWATGRALPSSTFSVRIYVGLRKG